MQGKVLLLETVNENAGVISHTGGTNLPARTETTAVEAGPGTALLHEAVTLHLTPFLSQQSNEF